MKAYNFHYRGESKVIGKENDMRECILCRRIMPLISFGLMRQNSNGVYYLDGRCQECFSRGTKESRLARKNATPEPKRCECCRVKTKLQPDHIHGSYIFRGWLCGRCNTAMGKLGDNLEGILQAAIYLENDKDKIIETLHKVFDEMFARTNEEK
jgi:hypothetical protein